jgi:WhiB family redox-sensing transcriptional regulator
MRPPREFENPLCAQVDGELWFPDKGGDTTPAKKICNQCIHITECAEWGIKHEAFGIWGGIASRERQHIRKKLNILLEQPRVEDWLGNVKA